MHHSSSHVAYSHLAQQKVRTQRIYFDVVQSYMIGAGKRIAVVFAPPIECESWGVNPRIQWHNKTKYYDLSRLKMPITVRSQDRF